VISRSSAGTNDRVRRTFRRTLLVAALAVPTAAAAQGLPASSLAVRAGGRWVTWWRSGRAPRAWTAPLPVLAGAARWTAVRPGIDRAELRLAGDGEAWRIRVVLVRVDPRRVRFELREATRMEGLLGNWTVDSIPAAAVLALNAGQFTGGRPWGWVVRDGVEEQPPGAGPLAMAVVVDSRGGVHLAGAGETASVRAAGGIAQAFQSYPALLMDGAVPMPLRASGRGIDVAHRDARLALGTLADGRLLIALTRFDALGGTMDELPVGPTTPEMAALMGALGCRRAVLLDGGISAQLLLRPAHGVLAWRAWRRVPLGLVAFPR